MVSVLQNVATAAIWFAIVWLPILLVVGAITLVVVWIARRIGLAAQAVGEPAAAGPDRRGVAGRSDRRIVHAEP